MERNYENVVVIITSEEDIERFKEIKPKEFNFFTPRSTGFPYGSSGSGQWAHVEWYKDNNYEVLTIQEFEQKYLNKEVQYEAY